MIDSTNFAIPLWMWVVFHLIIAVFIAADLYIQRKDQRTSLKKNIIRLAAWIGIGVAFGLLILGYLGLEPSILYFTAYSVEYTLSFDNLFIFAAIFSYFAVPFRYQNKVLYIGIISAIVMRALFLLAGLKLVQELRWVMFVLAAILVYSGIKFVKTGETKIKPGRNPVLKILKKVLPVSSKGHAYSGFVTKEKGRWLFTPLILVLIALETTDIIFAVDSIPAVIAITLNFFIAYTSNILAILGLRTLYLIIANVMFELKYLKGGLAFVLIFLGAKMVLNEFGIIVPSIASITIVLTSISVSAFLSFYSGKK